jgi:hypothetical protein
MELAMMVDWLVEPCLDEVKGKMRLMSPTSI